MEKADKNIRHKWALAAVYTELTYLDMGEAIDVKAAVEGATSLSYERSPLFVKEIAISALKHLDEAIAAFESRMRGWTWKRLNRVEQALLLNAYCHYFYVEEGIDKAIVITVAVDLAKEYLDATDYRFVNAILDNVLVKKQ